MGKTQEKQEGSGQARNPGFRDILVRISGCADSSGAALAKLEVRAYPNNYDGLRFDKNRMDARTTDAGDPNRVVEEV
ncbi:MAG: hypothetical protein HZA50_06710 [Planctomycetes bacterium]|nr:hypothetical protein [Planctomycetota bacterium]